MENKVSPFKPALNSGIILALVSIVISILVWVFGLMESMGIMGAAIMGITSLVITLVLLVIFTKSYRDKFFGGKFTYGKAFVFGFLVVVISALLTAIYNYIFNTFIDPEYMQNIALAIQDKTVSMMENSGANADAIDEVLVRFEEQGVPSALKQIQNDLVGGIIGGAVMALISAAIVKKDTTTV